jgi:tellurite methyltransferase
VIRTIEGFHQDDVGDWVAELSCRHSQHVRHHPPFRERSWVEDAAGRRAHIGTPIDCPRCDGAELPDGLQLARIAGPFDQDTIPAGLHRDHRVAEHTWAVVNVLEGAIDLELATDPPQLLHLAAGDAQPIPPTVAHRVITTGPVRLEIRFLI